MLEWSFEHASAQLGMESRSLANTQRPPPPVLQLPAQSDDLQALSEALEVIDQPTAAPAQPARANLRGGEDDVLDLSALAKSGVSVAAVTAPQAATPDAEASRVQLQLKDEPIVASRTRPTWLVPLLIGVGFGAGLNALWFANLRGGDHPSAHVPQIAPAAANTAPAALPPVPVAAKPQPPVTTNLPAAAAPQSPSIATRAMAGAAANAIAQRSATKIASSTAEPTKTYASAVAPNEPKLPALTPAPAVPSAGPPVLVVRPAAQAASPSSAAPAPTAPRSSGGSIDALLDDALSPEARRAELARGETAPPAEVLPATPSPQDVAKAVGSVQFAIRGCAMGQTGNLTAAMSVRSDGRVGSAQVIGAPFAGTPAGRCMEGVLRSAHFPQFKQSIFNVQYALKID
jgi:hypothetical protein